nr:Na+ dependent nucleoside transporter N-terminal domain-containing protein [Siphonobacter sp. BAB-5405]
MDRFTGLIGIIVILGIAFALSNNRKAINYRTVGIGLALQVGLAVFILKTSAGQQLFGAIGELVKKLLDKSQRRSHLRFRSPG